ncbi:DgyrCDS6539 [Dimorphilus gyrociliatus]|uniref:DgyrCDS6539 n=1 Tax=Dimorphilus gyrociliatus TaxID=2664684 RepID=A0A7I8VNZ5_9ANNE|nr:DgyrCDS6539 [Dimorphilus gyrociliatus]
MAPAKTELLFIDTFSHSSSDAINLDLIQFIRPVVVKEVRVIPLGTRVQADIPGGIRLGATNPSQFDLDIFVNNLKEQTSTFEKFGNIKYKANVNILFEADGEPIPTDGLVIRGIYTTITLAVYGNETIQTRSVSPPIQQPKVRAPDVLTTRPVGGGINRPDNLTKPPIDLPGVNQKVSEWLSMAPSPQPSPTRPISPHNNDQRHVASTAVSQNAQSSPNDPPPSIPIESTGQVHDPRASRARMEEAMPITVVTSMRIGKTEPVPNPTLNEVTDDTEPGEIPEDIEMVSDEECQKGYETISSGEDNLSDLNGVPSRKQLTDMDVSGLDIVDSEGWTYGVASFNPYQFQLVPLEAFSDPALTPHEIAVHKLNDNKSLSCQEADRILQYIQKTEGSDADWVDRMEQVTDMLVPGLAHLMITEFKNQVLDCLCEWALRGLDTDSASRQPVTHMVRHLKAGIRLCGALCACHDDIAFRLLHRDVQHQLVQLLGRREMASSIKLLILRSLDQTTRVKDGLLWFIGGHPIQKKVDKCVYAELIEQVIDDRHDQRVLKALSALCNKLNLYDSLHALNDNVRLTIAQTEEALQKVVDKEDEEFIIEPLQDDVVQKIVTCLEHMTRSLINARFTLSQPSRIPIREVLYEVHLPSHDPLPDILRIFNSSGILKACNVLLTSPSCTQHPSIILAAKKLIEQLCSSQAGLLFLAFNPDPVNSLIMSILQSVSRDDSEESMSNSFVLHLVYHLQSLLYVDELKMTISRGGYVLGVLHNLFVLTLSPIGRDAVVRVLGLEDNLLPLLQLADIGEIDKEDVELKKKAILLHYVFNLILLVLRHSTNTASLLERHGLLLNKLSKNEMTIMPKINEKIHEMSEFLSPISSILDKPTSLEVLPVLLEQMKHLVDDIECTIPKGLVTILRLLQSFLVQPVNNEWPVQLVYERAVAESQGAIHYLANIVQKCADITRTPWLKCIPLQPNTKTLIISTLTTALSSLTALLQKTIKARGLDFKDTTAVESLFNAHAVFCSVTPNGHLSKEQLDIQEYIVACLAAYTQPLICDNKAVSQSVWTGTLKNLLKWMLTAPYTILSGLVLLSELLPLPLPIQTKKNLEKDDQYLIIQPRKLCSAHLLPLDEQLRDVVNTLAVSSCSPLQHILKRVCWQLSDLTAPSASVMATIVLDLVAKTIDDSGGLSNSNLVRVLDLLVFLADKPSFKAAAIALLNEETYENILRKIASLLNVVDEQNRWHSVVQEAIIGVYQCLCDCEVSLLSLDQHSVAECVSNSLPSKKHLYIIIESIFMHIGSPDQSYTSVIPSLKTLYILLEHDFGLSLLHEYLAERDSSVFYVLFDRINGTFSKDSHDHIATLTAAVEVLHMMVQNKRKDIITINRLKLMLNWPKEMHPLDDLENLLSAQIEKQDENLRTLHDAMKDLVSILKEEDMSNEWKPVELPNPLPLHELFNLRTVSMFAESDENRLSDTFWLATPMGGEGERETVPVNLIEIVNEHLPDVKLKEELMKDTDVATARRIRARAPRRQMDMINTSKTQGSSRGAFAAPMRGRGFARGASTRNDLFRSRPPNTSRPPSMHVDDFIKMENSESAPDDATVMPPPPTITTTPDRPRSIYPGPSSVGSGYRREDPQQWRSKTYASSDSNHYSSIDTRNFGQNYLYNKFVINPQTQTPNSPYSRRTDARNYMRPVPK